MITIEKIETKSSETSLKINGYLIHSKYNPIKEANQFAEKVFKKNHLNILFGYGLGYYTNAIIERDDYEDNLIIVDPLLEKLIIAKNHEHLLMENEVSEANINKILHSKLANYDRQINIICTPNYDKIFPQAYKELLTIVKDLININLVNENTTRSFSYDWQKNYLENLFNSIQDESLLKIHKNYDCPVVVASGGPSLIKQIPLIKKNRENFILISSGSTINTLLFYGISPDYIVSIDGQIHNYNHFKDLSIKNETLIYSMSNHHKIREVFNEKSYYFHSLDTHRLSNHMEKSIQSEVPTLIGGGSVANYALSIASYITLGPIALIGQDLAYTDNKSHAEHNKHFSLINEQYKMERGMFMTKGYYNVEVLTDYAFFSMKKSFEQLFTFINQDNELYNCTEGGIFLEGINQMPFRGFCEKYATKSISKVKMNYPAKNNSQYFILKDKMENELTIYTKLIFLLEKSLKSITSDKLSYSFSNKTLKRLNESDREIKMLMKNVSMSNIVDPITIDIMKNFIAKESETDKEIFTRVYNQHYELYSRLLEATTISIEFTNNLIDKIEKNKKGENNE